MPAQPFQRVSILGVGLIGGSIALALRDRQLASEVVGYARTDRTLQSLLEWRGSDRVERSISSAVEGAELIVVATPVGSIVPVVREAATHCPPSALLTDAGSTKEQICEGLRGPLAEGGEGPCFIGSHPIAGDHRTGASASRADLFEGATVVLTPTESTPHERVERLSAFWEALGAKVELLAPNEHDRLLASASHLPHVAAAALAASTPAEALRLVATGWADSTRVAAGSPTLWREILLANRTPTLQGIARLKAELQKYEEALAAADGEAIQRLLEQGRQQRDALGS